MSAADADAPDEANRKRPMTLSEAGKRGGEKVKRERGRDYYAEIGRKGGASVKERRGPAFYAEIGRKGGEARRKDAPPAVADAPERADMPGAPMHENARSTGEMERNRPFVKPDRSDLSETS